MDRSFAPDSFRSAQSQIPVEWPYRDPLDLKNSGWPATHDHDFRSTT